MRHRMKRKARTALPVYVVSPYENGAIYQVIVIPGTRRKGIVLLRFGAAIAPLMVDYAVPLRGEAATVAWLRDHIVRGFYVPAQSKRHALGIATKLLFGQEKEAA